MVRLEDIYAFVFDREDEDIVAVRSNLGLIPLVGAGKERMETLRPLALQVVQQQGVRIKVLRFTNREELEILGGS